MVRVKQFSAAVVALALAVAAGVVGALALTVWKPADQVVATTTPDQPYVMTHDGVLPLFAGGTVTVGVTAPAGEHVTLVLGTTADVMGWIGDAPYTEVVGVESGMTTLKTVDHPALDTPQSGGAQSGESQSGDAQSGEGAAAGSSSGGTAQSGATPEGNDMWLDESSGTGSATLELRSVGAGRSVLAAVDGVADAPTITLTWSVPHTNVLAIVAFVLAAAFLVAALGLALTQRRVGRSRERRAHRLADVAAADSTDTQQIDAGKVRSRADGDERPELGDVRPAPGDEGGTGAAHPAPAQAGDASTPGAAPTPGGPVTPEDAGAPGPRGPHADDEVDAGGDTRGDADDEKGGDAGSDTEADAGGDTDGDTGTDADEDGEPFAEAPQWEDILGHARPAGSAPATGRHGSGTGPIDEDPPERHPTDSGVIDLSAIRPGAAFPTRRALREARAKGEERFSVDGHEFDTGVVPLVPGRPDTQGHATRVHDAQDHDTQGHDTEHGDDPERHDARGQDPAPGQGWTSMMPKWLRNSPGEGE